MAKHIKIRWISSVRILKLEKGFPVLPVVLIMAVLPEPAISNDDVTQRIKDSTRLMSSIRSLLLRMHFDDDACNQNYTSKGTDDDPYIVDYLQNDRQDAMNSSRKQNGPLPFSNPSPYLR